MAIDHAPARISVHLTEIIVTTWETDGEIEVHAAARRQLF